MSEESDRIGQLEYDLRRERDARRIVDATLAAEVKKLKDRDESIRALREDLELERNLVANLRPIEKLALDAESRLAEVEGERDEALILAPMLVEKALAVKARDAVIKAAKKWNEAYKPDEGPVKELLPGLNLELSDAVDRLSALGEGAE